MQKVLSPEVVRCAAGDFLFDLGHTHGLLGDIIGERNVVIIHEAPDIVGIGAQTVKEIEGFALPGFAAFAGRRRTRIDGLSLGENPSIGRSIVRDAIFCQRPPEACLMARPTSNPSCAWPSLPLLGRRSVAQVVGVAQAVRAIQIAIRLPAIVDQRTGKCGQNPEGVEGFFAPVHMTTDPGQHGRGQDMQPVERTRYAHPGFVGVGDGHSFQGIAHGSHRWREKRPGFVVDRQHGGIRQRQTEQIAHQVARASDRHHVVMRQMNSGGLDARAVLHRRRHRCGKLAPMHLAAGATRFVHLVLSDFVAQGGMSNTGGVSTTTASVSGDSNGAMAVVSVFRCDPVLNLLRVCPCGLAARRGFLACLTQRLRRVCSPVRGRGLLSYGCSAPDVLEFCHFGSRAATCANNARISRLLNAEPAVGWASMSFIIGGLCIF